jgi:hypothetical protein
MAFSEKTLDHKGLYIADVSFWPRDLLLAVYIEVVDPWKTIRIDEDFTM